MSAGHRQIEHTADLALEIWAPTEAELLLESARALTEILTEGASIEPRDRREVAAQGLDPEDRLVRWLNELLVLAVSGGFLFARAERINLAGDAVSASVLGEAGAADRIKTELKSVTYHQLALFEADGEWRARVVIDV